VAVAVLGSVARAGLFFPLKTSTGDPEDFLELPGTIGWALVSAFPWLCSWRFVAVYRFVEGSGEADVTLSVGE
jgi:hypothetical protein